LISFCLSSIGSGIFGSRIPRGVLERIPLGVYIGFRDAPELFFDCGDRRNRCHGTSGAGAVQQRNEGINEPAT